MKKFLIVYHVEDNDGVCSAAIILNHLLENLHIDRKEIDLLGSTYNSLNRLQAKGVVEEEWPKQYNHVIMTDISFNDWKMMKFLHKTFGDNFTWIDHHAPIINLSKEHDFDSIQGMRSTLNSAMYNAYIYLHDPFHQVEAPYVLKVLSAWDNWTYERDGYDQEFCRAFNRGFTIESNLSVNWYLEHIKMILDPDLSPIMAFTDPTKHTAEEIVEKTEMLSYVTEIFKTGKKACEKEDDENKEMIRVNGDKEWNVNGIPAIFVVTTGATNSLMFKSLMVDKPTASDLRIAVVAKHCSDGNWTISLYNIYDFDGDTSNPFYFHCGKYLQEKYNGGGHEGAAGCTLTVDKFCKVLKSKTL